MMGSSGILRSAATGPWADVERNNDSPLLVPLMQGNLAAIGKMLEKGKDVNAPVDRGGRLPLAVAAGNRRADVVRFLLNAGANVLLADKNGCTALHIAAQENSLEICRMLVEAGASVDARDAYGSTPLAKAVSTSKGRGEVITYLLSAGADPDIRNSHGISAKALAALITTHDVSRFFP